MKRNLPLTILLVLSFVIAIFTLNNFGESWDELKLYDYASDSLEAYTSWPLHGTIPVTGDHFENYGPAFVMFTSLLTKALTRVFPTLVSIDVQHLIYFLAFLVSVWAFYHLARRWMSDNAAFGGTLLFVTQPLFWGHAFINPKDIPLLALFLLAVYLGLRLHDSVFGGESGSVFKIVSSTWRELPPRTRRLLIAVTSLWLASMILLFGSTPLVHQWLDNAVRAAAHGEPSLVTQIAPRIQHVAPETYIEKFFVLFLRIRTFSFLLLTVFLIWLYRHNFPQGPKTFGMILSPGMILGLAISIRIFGVWSGVLVAGYMLWKSGRKALLLISVYGLIAIMTMYLTWPYLWPNPIGHFLETVQIMAQHPWPGSVLFDGATYPANHLPAWYVPLLLAIQLTEPVWALFVVGLVAAVFGFVKERSKIVELLALTLMWFALPLVTFMVLRPTLYDNFRQCFFIVPPIFFMAGLAFDLIRKPLLQSALIALVILPGVVAAVRLHPYEYVYYNQFIGGVSGAVDRFELDYWGTSYREEAKVANRIAPPNASVWVDGPAHLFNRFARPDFHIYSSQEAERADHYDIVVTLARYNWEKTSFPDAAIVYRVIREGAVFSMIRKP